MHSYAPQLPQKTLKIIRLIYILFLQYLCLLAVVIPTQAKADEPVSTKRSETAIIGETKLREFLARYPTTSQVSTTSNGTSVIYVYDNTSNSMPLKNLARVQSANGFEFIFDKNQLLSSINLIKFEGQNNVN